MTNIANLLKTEIARIARKQVRAELATVKKSSTQHRSAIAALRREVDALQRQIKALAKRAPPPRVGTQVETPRRFRRDGLVSHRKGLGLSAADYGALVGVTGQTIYKWEEGKAHPRPKQLDALAAVRGIGKREATARLEALASETASSSRTHRRKPRKATRRSVK